MKEVRRDMKGKNRLLIRVMFVVLITFLLRCSSPPSSYSQCYGDNAICCDSGNVTMSGNLDIDGNATANAYFGDGSYLTGVGEGTITSVWTDSDGDVSALTATTGDTLNASSADSTIPFKITSTAPTTEGQVCWDPNSNIQMIGDGASTVYNAYGSTDGDALAGDSATSFFDTGTIEYERGGLEDDVSGYSGLVAISGGSTSEVDALSELEGQIADVSNFVVEGTACSDIEGTGLSITTGTLNWDAPNDSVTLTTHTVGDYVESITNGSGISGGDGGSEGAALTLSATLGTSISLSELDANSVDSDKIVDYSISNTDIADGDHGDFTYSSGSATLDNDVVGPDEMADGDYGDFTFTSGSAALDNDVVGADEIDNGDYGDFTFTSGSASIDTNVIEPENIADGDYGDFTFSGNSATLDTGVVGDNEIDYSAVTLDDFDYQTAWRLFYSNTDGDVTELAFGANGEYLKSQGTTSAPTWDTPSGGGGSASCIEASDGDPNDALCADADGNLTANSSITVDFGSVTSFELPNNNGDVTADAAGEIFYDEAEDQWVWYDSQGGELSGEEVADTGIKHVGRCWDPGDWYDRDQDAFIMTVGDDFPSGMIIDEWQFSCNGTPGTEINADLFYADDWLTLSNLTIMDALDTTGGVSSEDTDASINSGSAVSNGKKIGIRMNLDPEDPNCNQVIFEMWGHAVD